MKQLSVSSHIVAVAAIGFLLIGYLVWVSPLNAPVTIPLILAAMLAYMGILQKQTAIVEKVAEVKADQAITNKQVARSIDVSTENAHAIAAVAVQQSHAIEAVSQQVVDNTRVTEVTHGIVNSQRTAMLDELAAMRREIAAMKQAKAVEVSSEARIIAAVEKAAP